MLNTPDSKEKILFGNIINIIKNITLWELFAHANKKAENRAKRF